MTTTYALSLAPTSSYFPKSDPVPAATDPASSTINILEAAAEDAASDGQGIADMLNSALDTGGTLNIFA